jgi:copper(I)-binding protein
MGPTDDPSLARIPAAGRALAVLALVAALALAAGLGATAHEGEDHGTPGAGTPGATPEALSQGLAYMTIANAGPEPDRLVGGRTAVARAVEVHETVQGADGVLRMPPMPDGLEVSAGGSVTLEPDGYHVMLVGLTESLMPGMTFDLTLTFAAAGEVTVPVHVRPTAEPSAGTAPTVATLGALTIENAWSRPAPLLGGGAHDHHGGAAEAAPVASPTAAAGA